ncbi:hypothetical protein PsYK624_063970 [Phanerochaete sordida]|uniref:Uncharacterized protein n=1 Tax=Phanerochaete sordida TaxID=48140 RepID=A0A9P3LDE8_9APHY|nr:hypothetical protein PsYK624_063970 [Phanerochaete sordida]
MALLVLSVAAFWLDLGIFDDIDTKQFNVSTWTSTSHIDITTSESDADVQHGQPFDTTLSWRLFDSTSGRHIWATCL